MSNLGVGVMAHMLSGGSEHSPSEYYGRKILGAAMEDDTLSLQLDGGKTISIWDSGQSCCEERYMTTDDDIGSLIGAVLARIEAKSGPDIDAEYGEHETIFVEVGTDKGFVTIVNHNEHNGYYGGFGLTITEK
jgi:hypothetical protein